MSVLPGRVVRPLVPSGGVVGHRPGGVQRRRRLHDGSSRKSAVAGHSVLCKMGGTRTKKRVRFSVNKGKGCGTWVVSKAIIIL